MTKLLTFFLGHFPGSIWVYIGVSVALLSIGAYGGNLTRGLVDRPVISAAQADKAAAEKATADETALYNAYHAQVEKNRADDAVKFENERTGLEQQVAALSAKAKEGERRALNEHQQLLKVLANAPQPPPGTPVLDPAIAAYARSLHDLQAGRGSEAAPARNPQ